MRAHRKIAACFLTLPFTALLLAGNAQAQDPAAPAATTAPTAAAAAPAGWRGFYLGAGGSYSNVSVEVDQGTCDYDCYWGDYYAYDQGVGVGFNLTPALQLQLDLQTLGIDEDALNAQEDTSLDSILFEVQYRFGAH